MNEEVRGKSESYEARFVSEAGEHYSAKIPLAQWKSLKKDAEYQLAETRSGAYGQSSLQGLQLTSALQNARSAATAMRTPRGARSSMHLGYRPACVAWGDRTIPVRASLSGRRATPPPAAA